MTYEVSCFKRTSWKFYKRLQDPRINFSWWTFRPVTTENDLEESRVAHGLSVNLHVCPGTGDTGMNRSDTLSDSTHAGWNQDHPDTPRMCWWLSLSGWPHFPCRAKSIRFLRPTPSVAGPSISWQSESELLSLPGLPTCHVSRSPNSWRKPISPWAPAPAAEADVAGD